jgi:hypothetical protein
VISLAEEAKQLWELVVLLLTEVMPAFQSKKSRLPTKEFLLQCDIT